mmetsp:Transcript_61939/g.98130  ORF Transcript_61939/g.98130 Transcript_61939/m.98130 type:complete len:337 (+) Transcript_61939:60-1070(+)
MALICQRLRRLDYLLCTVLTCLPRFKGESQHHRIPRQLILTGKPDTFDQMPSDIQSNVVNNIRWNLISIPQRDEASVIRMRWFGDSTCHAYISEHYDAELLKMFDDAHPGYYRGDICRAAVLYNEGGFYTDVDVELALPLVQLVDENTTFMSSFSINGDIFNGIIAVEPKSSIMNRTLQEIRKWYNGKSSQTGLMGTMTMLRGLEDFIASDCPDKRLNEERRKLQWGCGNQNVRLYQEADLFCFPEDGQKQPRECPQVRRDGEYFLRLGFIEPGQEQNQDRTVVAWPRFHSCKGSENGCGSGGHSLVQKRIRTRRRFLSSASDSNSFLQTLARIEL